MDDSDREKDLQRGYSEKEKDADVVVVDASVLVHALHQVKRWCREGREEVVIVPLEGVYFRSFGLLSCRAHPNLYGTRWGSARGTYKSLLSKGSRRRAVEAQLYL
jgi:hypothetical protein